MLMTKKQIATPGTAMAVSINPAVWHHQQAVGSVCSVGRQQGSRGNAMTDGTPEPKPIEAPHSRHSLRLSVIQTGHLSQLEAPLPAAFGCGQCNKPGHTMQSCGFFTLKGRTFNGDGNGDNKQQKQKTNNS